VALWRAREGQIGAEEALWSAARDQKLPAIERASVVEELAGFPSPELESLARELVRSENVYMRRAVVSLAFTVAPQAGIEILLTLLHDEVRSVRFEAMDALLAVPQAALPKAQRPRYEKVLAEYTASRLSISDQADAQLDLSEIAEALGKSEEAAERLLALIRREPTLSTAYLNLADLYRRQGKVFASFESDNGNAVLGNWNWPTRRVQSVRDWAMFMPSPCLTAASTNEPSRSYRTWSRAGPETLNWCRRLSPT